MSLQDPRYRYPRSSTGTLGTDTPNPCTDTPLHFPQPKIPVAKLSTDTQGEYRYPRHEKGNNGWKMFLTAPNNSQRSPTARYTIGTIKQASKHQEKGSFKLWVESFEGLYMFPPKPRKREEFNSELVEIPSWEAKVVDVELG
ncbi:hypothetical protein GQ457_07G012040 [Hibiscus cannabinus]